MNQTTDSHSPAQPQNESDRERPLGAQALRALAEAAQRRRDAAAPPEEIGGRGGLDPVRYGDWEVGGLATDF